MSLPIPLADHHVPACGIKQARHERILLKQNSAHRVILTRAPRPPLPAIIEERKIL